MACMQQLLYPKRLLGRGELARATGRQIWAFLTSELLSKVLLLLATAGMQTEEGWPFSGLAVEGSPASREGCTVPSRWEKTTDHIY